LAPNHLSSERLTYLFQLLLDGAISPTQRQELFELMSDGQHRQLVDELLRAAWEEFDFDQTVFSSEESTRIFRQIRGDLQTDRPLLPRFSWNRFLSPLSRIAVAMLVLVMMGGIWYFQRGPLPETLSNSEIEVLPGRMNALLTLEDGRVIVLDEMPTGLVHGAEEVSIHKSSDAELVYQTTGKINSMTGDGGGYHTVATPRGGWFRIVLPDGSRVWLNAESSIRYPVRFEERSVELKGEAYFEVEKKSGDGKLSTFTVSTGREVVKVLGTHFNINTYENEGQSKTTLVEGSIEISKPDRPDKIRLTPGQQCASKPGIGFELVHDANVSEVVAWRNNQFSFNAMSIRSVMRQLERWYDVHAEFEGSIPEEPLTGYISREIPLQGVIKMLEEISDLSFEIRGKTVLISDPKRNL
jgi:transmembrane sensor